MPPLNSSCYATGYIRLHNTPESGISQYRVRVDQRLPVISIVPETTYQFEFNVVLP